ncbi:MAG TPA: hypothetical protein VLC95_08050 [Anaerolineae bacterium]|nr:hypothetical protein [Anaerolineae bacterium]
MLCFLAVLVWTGGCAAPPVSVSPGAGSEGGLVVVGVPGEGGHPTLADFWEGRAEFVVEVRDTGLPRGESDTVVMGNGELWSYLHASERSAGIVDRCGDPVEFPGCTVVYKSSDGGLSFSPPDPPTCLFECAACPCEADVDHVVQQQYPRVFYDGETIYLVYEYLGRVMLRRSADGVTWSAPERVDETGIWKQWLRSCPFEERIGPHPYVRYDYECLAGGPPGIWVEDGVAYVFLAVGQNPGGMGCYLGPAWADADKYGPCHYNPLFSGAAEYGPLDVSGPAANAYFDFRTISSAEVVKAGERYYMLYEGIRGPEPGEAGDSQFGLGLARSAGDRIDGPWETYPGNPILVDLPGNIGLGHADLVVIDGQTILYTALERSARSRLALVWRR